MPRVLFTPALRRFVTAAPAQVEANSVAEALAAVFATNSQLRGYVLDDQGLLRRHVAIYVNGERLRDRAGLADPVGPGDEIHVFQALTGG